MSSCLVKKWGKDLAVCHFSTTFVCKLHTYLDMKTMNRLRNMAPKGVKVPPGSCVPSCVPLVASVTRRDAERGSKRPLAERLSFGALDLTKHSPITTKHSRRFQMSIYVIIFQPIGSGE